MHHWQNRTTAKKKKVSLTFSRRRDLHCWHQISFQTLCTRNWVISGMLKQALLTDRRHYCWRTGVKKRFDNIWPVGGYLLFYPFTPRCRHFALHVHQNKRVPSSSLVLASRHVTTPTHDHQLNANNVSDAVKQVRRLSSAQLQFSTQF